MTIISCLLVNIILSSTEIGFVGKLFIVTILILLLIPGYHFFLHEVQLKTLDAETAKKFLESKQYGLGGGERY